MDIYLKKLLILIIFQNGNLKDCLMKVLKLLLDLINTLGLNYIGNKVRVKFAGGCLKKNKITKNSKYLHCLWNTFVEL